MENDALHWESLQEEMIKAWGAATASVVDGLSMSLPGAFNHVASDADNVVRGRVKTLQARRQKSDALDEEHGPFRIDIAGAFDNVTRLENEILLAEVWVSMFSIIRNGRCWN